MTGTPGASGSEHPVADPRDYVQDGRILVGVSKSAAIRCPNALNWR